MSPTVAAVTATATSVTSAASSALLITPAVTATISANPKCTANHLTMIGVLNNEVWLNDPLPGSDVTYTTCYASAVISSIVAESSGSNLQPFNPLLGGCAGAAAGYTEVASGKDGYVACCPSGYSLHTQANAPSTRIAFGATCYSNMPTFTTSVTFLETNGVTSTQGYYNPDAQAYAYVIDGYPKAIPSTSSSSTSVSATPTRILTSTVPAAAATSTNSSSSKRISGGAIGGIIAGVIIGVLLLLLASYLLLRRQRIRRRAHGAAAAATAEQEQGNTPYGRNSFGSPLDRHGQPTAEMSDGSYFPDTKTGHEVKELPTVESPGELPIREILGELPGSELPRQELE